MTSRVLLVVNVQVGLISSIPSTTVGDNIALVLEHARRAEHAPRIIHIRNGGEAGEPDEEGTSSWELLNAPLAGELLLDKRKSNAFFGTNLAELVGPDAEVVVIGLLSEYSIKSKRRSRQEVSDLVIGHTINSTCPKGTFHIGTLPRLEWSPI